MPGVVVLCKTLLKGGAEKQSLILTRLLTEENIDVILVNWCGDLIDKDHVEYISSNFIRYVGLTGNPLKKWINLQKVIRTQKTSVILSYLTLANGLAAVTKLFNRKIKTVGGVRSDSLPVIKFFFERFVHNHINDFTVFNNYSARQKFIKKGFAQKRIRVIHNAINISSGLREIRSNGIVNIISVSRFVKLKDFNTAISSFKQLKDNRAGKKIKYKIVGYGPMEGEIRSLVKKYELENDVDILINPPNIRGLLKSSDIFLSTSVYEGLSNSIMEAMEAGLPIVATDVGDNPYLIRNAYNGFIVPPKNPKLIASKLEFLSEFEDIRHEFGKNSFKVIQDDFSESKLLENYLKLFSELKEIL